MLPILVVVPLLAAAVLALLLRNNPEPVKYIALLASLASLAIVAYITVYNPSATASFDWFNLGSYQFIVSVSTASTYQLLLLIIVAIITPLIFLYSIGFMDVPSEQPRYYFEMCVFAASMMLFAMSTSLITLLIAWEMLGITSYLLIGFWYDREHAPTAARKAITTIIIGDVALLLAVVILATAQGGFQYPVAGAGTGVLFLAGILMLIAAFTKSAQFPFHEWLSDAMEGPTPVSAFLHSSTMVKAGVFLVILMLPLFNTTYLLYLILVVGMASVIIGVTNALVSRHIKKILAYSTIEDLGLMLIPLAFGQVYAALALFFVQAFYKALLFMSAGSIIKANKGEEDIFKIFNTGQSKVVFITALIGTLSIAGFFPLSGFFGKYAVGSAVSSNVAVYAILVLAELGTSVYIFRWLFLPMRKNPQHEIGAGANSVPLTMIIPAIVLAVLVLFAAIVFALPHSGVLDALVLQSTNTTEALVVNAVAAAGLIIAYLVYVKGNRFYLSMNNSHIFAALNNNAITNGIYLAICSMFLHVGKIMGMLDSDFDYTTYRLSYNIINSGKLAKPLINGQTNNYVIGFVIGVLVLAAAVLYVVI